MLSPKYFIYLATGPEDRFKLDLTANPRIDAFFLQQQGFDSFQMIRPPQPLWIVEKVLRTLTPTPQDKLARRFQKLAVPLLKELSQGVRFTLDSLPISALAPDHFFEPPSLEPFFEGRCLLLTEIPELLRDSGQNPPWDPEDWLQYAYLEGKVRREAAVSLDRIGLPYCRRCGSSKQIYEDDCFFCGNSHCLTCANCQSMGLAKSCIPLYSAPGGSRRGNGTEIKPVLDFELTPPQLRAAARLVRFWEEEAGEFLVWAVCGAGKTEVSFGIIAKALTEGARILVAIPRKDVVQELLPRFERAFPEVPVVALYGGGCNRGAAAPLTIATTHQCLRFYRCFDLIILDEGDAYPYQGSAMLQFAVRRALKPGGKLVIMTATPDNALLSKMASGKLASVTIPARPHRKPLILPELVKLELRLPAIPGSGWEPPPLVKQFLIDVRRNQRKALIFLPTIKLIEQIGPGLIQWAQSQGIRGCVIHSRIRDRELPKAGLLTGAMDFVITSTILERGITIPDLDVLVLAAENETIFDLRTLVQIAGRAGRKGEPARVLFAAKLFTKAMRESCRWIAQMNEEGYRLGYLD